MPICYWRWFNTRSGSRQGFRDPPEDQTLGKFGYEKQTKFGFETMPSAVKGRDDLPVEDASTTIRDRKDHFEAKNVN